MLSVLDEKFNAADEGKRKKQEKQRKKEEKIQKKLREEEELKRKKQKDRLEREMELFESNRKKVKRLVYKTAMETNFELLKTDMLVKWREFERTNDLKDWYISSLLEEQDKLSLHRETSELHQMELVDKIIAIADEKNNEMHAEYLKNRNHFIREKRKRENCLEEAQKDDETFLRTLIYDMKCEYKQKMDAVEEQNSTLINNQKEKKEMDLEKVVTGIRINLESLWKEVKNTFSEYKSNTLEIRKWYLELKEKDARDNITILRLADKIVLLLTKIDSYKGDEVLSAAKKKKISDLKKEKAKFENAYNIMRDDMRKDSEQDQIQITILAQRSLETLKEIEKLKRNVETLLEYVILCQKLETEREKVLPFIHIPDNLLFTEENNFSSLQDLKMFWLRHANITLQNDYLKVVLEKNKSDHESLKRLFKEIFINTKTLPVAKTSEAKISEKPSSHGKGTE